MTPVVTVLRPKIAWNKILTEIWKTISTAAAVTQPTDWNDAFILAQWRWFADVICCVSVSVVQSGHSKLHVVPKFVRWISYSIACCEIEIAQCAATLKTPASILGYRYCCSIPVSWTIHHFCRSVNQFKSISQTTRINQDNWLLPGVSPFWSKKFDFKNLCKAAG